MVKRYLNLLTQSPDGLLHDVESNWQNYSTVGSPASQPLGGKPFVLASANVIAPQSFYTKLTGNVIVKTITPPYTDRVHMLVIEFAGTNGCDATGNIKTAVASVVSQCLAFVFDPLAAKYAVLP